MKLPVASARLTAWTGACLAGQVAPDDLASHAVPAGRVHRVAGLPRSVGAPAADPVDPSGPAAGEGGALSLPAAVAALRTAGFRCAWLLWPVPGDPGGLPGPAETNRLALAAGQAVLLTAPAPAQEGPPAVARPLLLVPSRLGSSGVLWSALPAQARLPGTTGLGEAERALKAGLREAAAELDVLDVARTRPEAAERLAALRDRPPPFELPPGYDGRARSVLDTAQRLAALLELAGEDDGAAVSRGEADGRRAVLRELERVVRHAFAASVNALAEAQVRAR